MCSHQWIVERIEELWRMICDMFGERKIKIGEVIIQKCSICGLLNTVKWIV
jgi:hypothetical protein